MPGINCLILKFFSFLFLIRIAPFIVGRNFLKLNIKNKLSRKVKSLFLSDLKPANKEWDLSIMIGLLVSDIINSSSLEIFIG